MIEPVILCPPSEREMSDGTRPGPCHVYSVIRCPDLNVCEPRGRCSHPVDKRRFPAPAEPAAPEHESESDDGGN